MTLPACDLPHYRHFCLIVGSASSTRLRLTVYPAFPARYLMPATPTPVAFCLTPACLPTPPTFIAPTCNRRLLPPPAYTTRLHHASPSCPTIPYMPPSTTSYRAITTLTHMPPCVLCCWPLPCTGIPFLHSCCLCIIPSFCRCTHLYTHWEWCAMCEAMFGGVKQRLLTAAYSSASAAATNSETLRGMEESVQHTIHTTRRRSRAPITCAPPSKRM